MRKSPIDTLIKEVISDTTCPTAKELLLYKDALLPKDVQHNIENHMLNCPVCELVIEIQTEFQQSAFDKGDFMMKQKLEGVNNSKVA